MFGTGERTVAYIGSADLMHRNLDRRVEALVRLGDAEHIAEVDGLFDLAFAPTTSSFHLGPAGIWTRHSRGPEGEPLADYQSELIRRHHRRRTVDPQ